MQIHRKTVAKKPPRGWNSSVWESWPFLVLVGLAFFANVMWHFGHHPKDLPHVLYRSAKHMIKPDLQVIDSIPGEGHFRHPHGVCLSPDNTLLFIAEWMHDRVQVFNTADNSFVRSIGKTGTGPGEFHNPSGCHVSPDGSLIYVADEDNDMVQVFRVADGSFVRSIGTPGDGLGHLSNPRGVTMTPDGATLIVADTGNHRVQAFRVSDGSHLRFYGDNGDVMPGKAKGDLSTPTGVVVSPNGEWLYVADMADHAIEAYRISDGEHVRRLGAPSGPQSSGSGDGEFDHPCDVYVSHSGDQLYVADLNNHRVVIMSAFTGKFIRTIGVEGTKRGEFKHPVSLALSDSGEWLYVSDYGNDRVQMLRVL